MFKENTYILDKGRITEQKVLVVKTYGRYFCRVKNPDTGKEWDVMCNRLTESLN